MKVLDDAQRRVVDHDGGPLLVLGSPGTGKTTVLVERWVRLGAEVSQPHRVLLLVPTRERALKLRDELPWRLPGEAVIEAPVHTWHAFAYHLVTRHYRSLGYAQPPVRLTTAEQWTVVRDLLNEEDPDRWGRYGPHLGSEAFVSEVADFCMRAGHRGLSDDDLEALAVDRPEHAAVADFAVRYRHHLHTTSSLDYAELVQAATRLLATSSDIVEAVRRRFTHVLVDDAQELAPAQLRLLRSLQISELTCAGDPDSGIEAFRGADPTWLSRFEELAGDHERIVLSTCHRYGAAIGEAATRLIAHSGPADHRASSFGGEEGAAELTCYQTMAGELEATARHLRSAHLLDGIPYERMAVLLAQPGTYGHPLERMLRDFEVPFRIASADRPLISEPAVRAILDVCRLALSDEPTDELCKAVLSSPVVGLHPYRIRDLEREAYLTSRSLPAVVEEDTTPELDELRRLEAAATAEDDEPADATFARVFETSAWCRELVATRHDDPEVAHHVDALVALSRALVHFVERRPGGTMRDYLASSGEAAFTAETWTPSLTTDGVHILSFHAAKGEGWDLVCVLGVAEGQIPKPQRAQGLFDPWALESGSAIDRAQAQLAEERRTLYVGLTRARRRLVVSSSPGVRQSTPSRFLDEAFATVPEPVPAADDERPVTMAEAVAYHRRTLGRPESSEHERAAAAAALAHIEDVEVASWWYRRDWTHGPALTPSGKLTTSYSRIGRFDECPLRYVLESVLGLDPQSTYQMKFGSLVHKIIERADAVHGDLTTWDQAFAAYRNEFMETHKDDYPNLVFARTYFRFGRDALRRWWRTERSNGETIAVEYSFDDLDLDGHTIRGRIDRVAKGPKGLVLTDYKTSRNAIAWQEAKDSLQLAIYYLAAKTYGDLRAHGEPRSMQLVYPGIEHTDRHTGSAVCSKRFQTPEEAEHAIERLRGILDEAAAERFDPSPEADCRWCRMKPLCPRWPEGKEVPR